MNNIADHITSNANKQPSDQELEELRKVQKYLKDNKVHELFNELLAKLIENKPEKVKQSMLSILKSMKQQKSTFFKKPDFENMYDSYDFFSGRGINTVPYTYLMQALQKIGLQYEKDEFLNKYSQFKVDRGVKKIEFINILDNQYKKKLGIQ